jgi:hypothetical protein
MMAETVTMTLASAGDLAQVRAVFTMRNLGNQPESMAVRFPLSFWNGASDGFFNCPENTDLRVSVDGQQVPTRRITSEPRDECDGDPMPWAAFDVTFPPGKDVTIAVSYTQRAYGDAYHSVLSYILETGAGWQGTIGMADIIVQMPYQVSPENVILLGHVGFGGTTSGAALHGKEVRWHFEDLEPTSDNNISLLFVHPQAWNTVLNAQAQVVRYPNDGEIWGRLGLASKRAISVRGRWLRADAGGVSLYQRAEEAYDKAVTLDSEDADWHYGFAELLWLGYLTYGDEGSEGFDTLATLQRTLDELQAALRLKLDHERARTLAQDIIWYSDTILGSPFIQETGDGGFVFLALTATPALQPIVTPTATQTPADTPTAKITLAEMATATPETQAVPKEQEGGNPLGCLNGLSGLTGLVLLPWAATMWVRRRARS